MICLDNLIKLLNFFFAAAAATFVPTAVFKINALLNWDSVHVLIKEAPLNAYVYSL